MSGEADLPLAVGAAQERIAHAIAVGGLQGDPLQDVLEAMSASLGVQLQLHGATVAAAARVPPPPSLTPEQMAEVVALAAQHYEARVADLQRRRTIRHSALVLVCAAALAGTAGAVAYKAGRDRGEAHHGDTERRLAAAFHEGTAGADVWAVLMENNDVIAARAQCNGPRAFTDAGGRPVCLLPVFLGPPTRTAPQVQ